MRENFLPYALPTIGEEEKQEVIDALESGWVTTGPRTKQFEEAMQEYLDVKHAIGVSSCTAALHLSLVALGIGEGDEVITTPLTFCSTVNVILHQRATPVLADISSDTWNIDPEKLEAAITPKTKAIIPVHYGGHPCEMDRILDLAASRNLAVVEDAAHSLGAFYKGVPIGKFGDTTCFSFYAIKNLTTGEGGMIVTNRDDLDEQFRILYTHGMSKDAITRYTSEGSWYYQIMTPGYKYNMTDLQAALGIHQLKKLDSFNKTRTKIAERYTNAFREIDEIDLPEVKSYVQHAWHLYPILINLDKLTIDRAAFIEELRNRNIGTTVNFIPIHLHPFYKNLYGEQEGRYPITEWIYYREITLPIYPRMTDQDVDDVIEAVADVITKFRR